MPIAPCFPECSIGKGADFSLGKGYGWALAFEQETPVAGSTGQETQFFLRMVTSSQQLAESLNVAGSASYAGSVFGGSVEAKYVQDSSINVYDTFLLVKVAVKNPTEVIRYPVFKPNAQELLTKHGWNEFEKSYGQYYMSGKITGGNYYGLVHIKTKSSEAQKQLTMKISAKGWGATAEGSLESNLREVTKDTETKITVIQSGGSGDPLEVTLDEMISAAKNFPSLVREAPILVGGIFEDYRSTVPLPENIPETSLIAVDNRRELLNELEQKYLFYKDLRSTINFVQENFDSFQEYSSLSQAEKESRKASLSQDHEGVTKQIEELIRKANHIATNPTLPTSYYQLRGPLPSLGGATMIKDLENRITKLEQEIKDIKIGTTKVKSAESSDVSGRATNADYATRAGTADSSGHAARATSSDRANGIENGTIQGNLTITGELTCGALICGLVTSPGRLHLASQTEDVYILTGGGEGGTGSVYVDCAWGGSGRLFVNQKEVRPK